MRHLHLSIKDQLAVESGPKLPSPICNGQRLLVKSKAVLSSACPLVIQPSVKDDVYGEIPVRVGARVVDQVGGRGEPAIDLLLDRHENPVSVMCDLQGAQKVTLELECQSVAAGKTWSATVGLTIEATTQPLRSHEVTNELKRIKSTRGRAEVVNQLIARAVDDRNVEKLQSATIDLLKDRVDRILNHLQKGNRLAEQNREDLRQDLHAKLLKRWNQGHLEDLPEFVNGLHTTITRMLIDVARRQRRHLIDIDDPAAEHVGDSGSEIPSGDGASELHHVIRAAWRRLQVRKPFQIWCRCLAAVARKQEEDMAARRAAIGAQTTMSVDDIGSEFSRQKQSALKAWAMEILSCPELGVMAPEFVYDLWDIDEPSLEARIPRLKRVLEGYLQERPALAEELFGNA